MPWGYAIAAVGTSYAANKGAKAAGSAAQLQYQGQKEALDYRREINQLPLALRNKFLPMLDDYYSGGEGQQQFVDDTMDSPFYDQMIRTGQEGILGNAGAMGMTRSGNVASDLNQSNQGVLQSLVNQRLSGISRLGNTPLDTQGIANQMNAMGQTQAQGQIGAANAMQQGYGGMLSTLMSGINNNWGQSSTPPPT